MSVQAVLEYMVNRVPWYKWSIRRIWSIFPRKSNLHLNASETSIPVWRVTSCIDQNRPKSTNQPRATRYKRIGGITRFFKMIQNELNKC